MLHFSDLPFVPPSLTSDVIFSLAHVQDSRHFFPHLVHRRPNPDETPPPLEPAPLQPRATVTVGGPSLARRSARLGGLKPSGFYVLSESSSEIRFGGAEGTAPVAPGDVAAQVWRLAQCRRAPIASIYRKGGVCWFVCGRSAT